MSETAPAIAPGNVNGQPQPLRKSILSKPAVFGSLIPIVTLLNAIVGMLLPQMMEPRVFGEYSLVVTLFNYGLIFDFGMSQMIDRRIPAHIGSGRSDLAQSIGEKLLWVRLGVGVMTFGLTAAVLAVLAVDHALPFGLSAGLFAALAGLADMIALGPVCIYRARSERREYAILIATLLFGLIVARLGGLILGGLTGCFAALAVWYVTCAVLIHRRMPLQLAARPGAAEALSLIKAGLPFFATSFIWAFYVTGNRWIASFLIEPDQFGQFAFSANIFSLLVGAAGGFSAFYYPKIAERIAGSGVYAVSSKLTKDLSLLTAAVSVIMGIGILLAGLLITLIYPRYLPSVETARIILVAIPPVVLASWLMPVSMSSGNRPLIDGLITFPVATLILGAAIVFLYQHFGEAGAAWGSTASAIPLIGMQLTILHHAKILRGRDALILFAVNLGTCLTLGFFAWALGSWGTGL